MSSGTSQKTVVQVGPISGFVLADVQYAPRYYQSWHDHEETRLILTVSGGFTESWARLHHSCGPSSALLRPAGEKHTNRYDARGASCINVRFGPEWASYQKEYRLGSGSNLSAEIGPLTSRLYREIRAGDSASPIGIQCRILEIMSRFFRPQISQRERKPPHWIESTIDLLRSSLNSPPDIFEVARLAGVHPAHLSRTFRRFMGMTIGTYLRQLRVELACTRLRWSQNSLADIALEVGFYDQAHFSRVFQQQMGVTPKEFRTLNRSS
jgi:AraC family transcriptional regulator